MSKWKRDVEEKILKLQVDMEELKRAVNGNPNYVDCSYWWMGDDKLNYIASSKQYRKPIRKVLDLILSYLEVDIIDISQQSELQPRKKDVKKKPVH